MTTQIFRDSAADRTFRAKWWTGRVVIYGLLDDDDLVQNGA